MEKKKYAAKAIKEGNVKREVSKAKKMTVMNNKLGEKLIRQKVLENFLPAVIVIDDNNLIKYCSESALSQYITSDEYLNQPIANVLLPEIYAVCRKALSSPMKEWQTFVEISTPTLNGTFECVIKPFETGLRILSIQHRKIDQFVNQEIEKETRSQYYEEQLMINSFSELFLCKDTENNIIRVNQAVADSINRTVEEMEGRPIAEFFPSEDAEAYYQDDLEVIKSGNAKLGIIQKYETPTGTRWVKTDKLPYRDKDGKIKGIIVYASDFTDIKSAKDALKQSERKYQTFFEASSDGIVVIDWAKGGFLECNMQMLNMFKVQREQILHHNMIDFSPEHQPDGRKSEEKMAEIFSKVKHGRRAKRYEWRYKNAKGEEFDAEVVLAPFQLEKDKLYLCIIRDISARKRQERALAENERKFKAVFNNAFQFTALLDKDWKVIKINDTSLKLGGLQREEVIGRSFIRAYLPFIDRDQWKMFKKGLFKAAKGELIRFSVDVLGKDDIPKVIDFSMKPILNEKQEVEMLVAEGHDITEKVDAIKALEINNNQLMKINAELDRFVYSASHDLRAPLTSILGLISVIKLNDLPEQTLEMLGLMGVQVDKLKSFISEIIDYSRNSRLEISKAPIDFTELMDDVLEGLLYMENAESIVKNINIETNEEEYHSDRGRLKVIFNNLVGNAIKYSDRYKDHKFINVDITLSAKEAKVTIEDNGQGIHEKHVNKIFDMFYRATDNAAGSGLGLFIVKEALDKLNGEIQVESEYGKGTKISVSLPNLKQSEEN